MRIKSHWHKTDKPKEIKEVAGAMAFIIWRVAQNTLKRLREDKFEIEAGPRYFAVTAEFLIFLIQIADRIAYLQLDGAARAEFTPALALRVAETLEENLLHLGDGAEGQDYRRQFISLLNERAADYADFGYTESGPDYAFRRYLGTCIMEFMGQRDKPWIMDQVIEIETPEAVATVQKGMHDLFQTPQPVGADPL